MKLSPWQTILVTFLQTFLCNDIIVDSIIFSYDIKSLKLKSSNSVVRP